ncbi:MAG: hypothetical protein GY820_30450, partial [Gammaproteobacteria bacterium]|nr:hypothetical protein [Gammaproteobacteria bacterium]
GDEEGESEGGRGHQGHPNQNPPTPMGYGNASLGGNGFYEEREERYDSDNAQRGQANAYQGQPNNNQQQQRYQNNRSQNHNRNEQQFKNRPPNQLCKRFGFRDDCSFDTFEFDFQLACEMHQIPAREKVNWLLMHLEGPIKEHARSWMTDRGANNRPTYEELIGELRPSFQQEISKEVAERKLVGREWNIFTSVDEFLHKTRELVQCVLLGLTRQWPDRIRSCLMQALPAAWDQILSSSNKDYPQVVEWLRAQLAKIQNTPQDKWDDWVKAAYREHQKGGSGSMPMQKSTPNLSVVPPKCFHCGSASHKAFNCGYQQQQQQQFRNPTPQPMQ